MYWNGVYVGQVDIGTSSTQVNTGSYGIVVGARYYNQVISELTNGYLDEVRVTKGAALWTQDFTPPARRDTLSISDGMMYNGACLDFDGTNDYVTIPHNLILDNENALTIECWINTSFDAAFPGEIGVIRKGSGSASGWTNAGWSIRLRDDKIGRAHV